MKTAPYGNTPIIVTTSMGDEDLFAMRREIEKSAIGQNREYWRWCFAGQILQRMIETSHDFYHPLADMAMDYAVTMAGELVHKLLDTQPEEPVGD